MINQQFNIAFDLFKFLSENPNQICFESDQGTVKGKDFTSVITNFALNMLVRGIKPRDLIGVDIDDTIIAHSLTQAITAIGASWINISQKALEADLPIKHVIFSTARMYHGASVHKIDHDWFKTPSDLTNDMRIRGYKDPDDVWMIAQSSGSTGTPKFIPITYKQYWHRVWDMNINMFDRKIDYFHSLYFPLKTSSQYHTMGAIFKKITVLVDTDPTKIVTYPKIFFSGSLMQMHKFTDLVEMPSKPFDIIAESGGAGMNKKDLEKFLKYFKTVQNTYGATETNRTYSRRYNSIEDFTGDMGLPILPDIGADIVDDLDNPVAVGEVGNIRLPNTPRHVTGYYNDPEETSEKFRNGYFYPGDLGYVSEDGKLFVTGRKNSNMINIGGIKFDPAAIESVAREMIGVKDCLVFKNTNLPMSEQLSMFVVGDVLDQIDREHLLFTIINNVSKSLGISQSPKTFYYIPSIPLNENGKPWRSAAEKIAEKLEPIVITVDNQQ